jgi:hypothetical protein
MLVTLGKNREKRRNGGGLEYTFLAWYSSEPGRLLAARRRW